MKKLLITFVLALMPSLFFAQSPFDKFDGKEGIDAVVINKKMFELAGELKLDVEDKDAQKYLKQVDKLENLKVFTTKNSKYAAEMKNTVEDYRKKASLEELLRVSENGKNIKIYVKQDSKSSPIKEMLLFVEGGADEDTVLMTLTGNIQL